MSRPPQPPKPPHGMTEKAARKFVDVTVARYGAGSALARARRMTFEYRKGHQPKWLTRAIELLEAVEAARNTRGY